MLFMTYGRRPWMLPVGQAQAALAAACGPNRWAAYTLPFANGKGEVLRAGSPLRAP